MATTEILDLVILDRMLPKLDGASVCRALRASAGPRLPVAGLPAEPLPTLGPVTRAELRF
ncbi:hypothetical protein BH24PSE2_BH24PSE2_24500 [soil metagenome]